MCKVIHSSLTLDSEGMGTTQMSLNVLKLGHAVDGPLHGVMLDCSEKSGDVPYVPIQKVS